MKRRYYPLAIAGVVLGSPLVLVWLVLAALRKGETRHERP